MSRRRDFFILLAHGKVITNIAQDTQADLFCWFKKIKIELKEILFFFIQYRLLHKHNQNSARYISVWLCTFYWECVYCSCPLGFSSISPGFVESDSVFVGQDCCNCIPSWDIVGKHSELLDGDEDLRSCWEIINVGLISTSRGSRKPTRVETLFCHQHLVLRFSVHHFLSPQRWW